MRTTMTAAEVLAKIEARKARGAVKAESQEEKGARLEAATEARRRVKELRARSWMRLNPV